MWRSHRNESKYSNAEKIAWEYVLPYKHLPIIDHDTQEANKLAAFLNKIFSKQALAAAVKRKGL